MFIRKVIRYSSNLTHPEFKERLIVLKYYKNLLETISLLEQRRTWMPLFVPSKEIETLNNQIDVLQLKANDIFKYL
jgi:hypothetical protein